MENNRMTIKTDDGNEYYYTVDTNPYMLGYSISTYPITKEIDSELKLINENNIIGDIFTKKEIKELKYCNMDIKELVGKYYDKYGNIYYSDNKEIYRFSLKIKYFAKIFKTIATSLNIR